MASLSCEKYRRFSLASLPSQMYVYLLYTAATNTSNLLEFYKQRFIILWLHYHVKI